MELQPKVVECIIKHVHNDYPGKNQFFYGNWRDMTLSVFYKTESIGNGFGFQVCMINKQDILLNGMLLSGTHCYYTVTNQFCQPDFQS